jgi:hypothetical protein
MGPRFVSSKKLIAPSLQLLRSASSHASQLPIETLVLPANHLQRPCGWLRFVAVQTRRNDVAVGCSWARRWGDRTTPRPLQCGRGVRRSTPPESASATASLSRGASSRRKNRFATPAVLRFGIQSKPFPGQATVATLDLWMRLRLIERRTG